MLSSYNRIQNVLTTANQTAENLAHKSSELAGEICHAIKIHCDDVLGYAGLMGVSGWAFGYIIDADQCFRVARIATAVPVCMTASAWSSPLVVGSAAALAVFGLIAGAKAVNQKEKEEQMRNQFTLS